MLGNIGWSLLALIIGVIVFPAMVAREWYQWKYQNTTGWSFEWFDVFRYGIFICVFGLFHWFILDMVFEEYPWYLAL